MDGFCSFFVESASLGLFFFGENRSSAASSRWPASGRALKPLDFPGPTISDRMEKQLLTR
jgi:hypothetical protein